MLGVHETWELRVVSTSFLCPDHLITMANPAIQRAIATEYLYYFSQFWPTSYHKNGFMTFKINFM
jgi:hypothetical protein